MTRGEAMAVVSIMGGSSIPGDGLTVSGRGGGAGASPLWGRRDKEGGPMGSLCLGLQSGPSLVQLI